VTCFSDNEPNKTDARRKRILGATVVWCCGAGFVVFFAVMILAGDVLRPFSADTKASWNSWAFYLWVIPYWIVLLGGGALALFGNPIAKAFRQDSDSGRLIAWLVIVIAGCISICFGWAVAARIGAMMHLAS
jgi:hypothetical protein